MKTIYLVTGAAGFMGTNVCAQLLERGDAVRAFVLKGDPAVKFVPKAVEIFEGDLCSAEDCEKFFAVEPGTQTVCIHCASMVTINPNYSEKLIAVNVGGTENMLNAAKNHPECKKFVYVSSTGTIPELPKGESIREVYNFVPYDDDRVVGWYSRSKAMATQKVLDAAADEAHCRVIFDPVNLFCARDGQDRAYQAAHWSRWLEVIGNQLGAVHVKDCRIGADGSKTLLPLGEGDMDYTAIRAFLAACAPAAPLIRDEVILTADTADVRYLRRMTDTV